MAAVSGGIRQERGILPDPARAELLRFLKSRGIAWRFCTHANYEGGEPPPFGSDYPQMEYPFYRCGRYGDFYNKVAPLVVAVRHRFGLDGELVRLKANLTFNTSQASGGVGAAHWDDTEGIAVVYYPEQAETGTVFLDESFNTMLTTAGEENSAVAFPANTQHAMVLPTSVKPRIILNAVFKC